MENFQNFINFLRKNLTLSDYNISLLALDKAVNKDNKKGEKEAFKAFLRIGEWDYHKKDGTIVIRAIKCQCQNVIPAYFIYIKNGQAEIKSL